MRISDWSSDVCSSTLHVLIAGGVPDSEPEYASLLRTAADKTGCRVHFVGWQRPVGVYRHMHVADVAVFPASQSVMWQQSIGSGLPLIVEIGRATCREGVWQYV